MGREERGQVRLDPDGAHSRASTTMGDTESLVKIEVTDVCSNDAWRRQPHLKPLQHILVGVLTTQYTVPLISMQHCNRFLLTRRPAEFLGLPPRRLHYLHSGSAPLC